MFKGEHNEPLISFCRQYLSETDPSIEYFVFGHRHILLDFPLGVNNSRMIILGDWIRQFSYGVFDGNRFSLHIFNDSSNPEKK